jgi:hypothetical protein
MWIGEVPVPLRSEVVGVAPPTPPPPFTEDLTSVLYWRFNEPVGSQQAVREGPITNYYWILNAWNGVLAPNGKVSGNCFYSLCEYAQTEFNGMALYGTFGGSYFLYQPDMLPINGPFSVHCWVKPDSVSASPLLYGLPAVNRMRWHLKYDAVGWEFAVFPDTNTPEPLRNNNVAPVIGTWYFLCVTWNPTTRLMTLRVNTTSTSMTASAVPPAGESLYLGGLNTAYPPVTHFYMDALGVHIGVILSASDQDWLYNNGDGRDWWG